MKLLVTTGLLATVALLSGCASQRPALVLDPVGPAPVPAGVAGSSGTLMVFSAFRQGANFNGPPYRRQYTDYKILSPTGKLLQWVRNDGGTLVAAPKPVALPTGTYRVVARANGYGEITVPVVIRPNQATLVHLEGSASWPDRKQLAASNPVRLPDGEIAGWRASVDRSSTP
jgi:hypothetical protein